MDKLTSELMESVDKNLPQMVGDQLKARLLKADADAVQASKVPGLERDLQTVKEQARALQAKETATIQRENEVTKREAAVDLREQLMTLREKHATERVSEMRAVVSDVFANSKFKYFDSGWNNTPNGSQNFTRSGESTIVPDR